MKFQQIAAAAPPRVAHIVEHTRQFLQRTVRCAAPPPVTMLELLSSAWLSQAIVAAAQLGIADALGETPQTASEIAQRLGINPDGTLRLLRALTQHGVFTQRADGRFEPSALSHTLRSRHPHSIRDFALFIGSAPHREHWSLLSQAVASGEVSVPLLRGADFFQLTQDDASFGALFGRAMSNLSELSLPSVLAAYDFARFSSLVDVGGGEGRLLRAILRQTPGLKGVLLELPQVIARAAEQRDPDLSERLRLVSGSFFEPLPKGHDAYLLKHILHDWDDARARLILARVREALGDHARGALLVVELVLPPLDESHMGKLFDLEMLLSVGGRERTLEEFARLLRDTGFALVRDVKTASPLCILEARAT